MLLYVLMSREYWSYAPVEAVPEHLEVQEPMQYTIPFKWGDWHVSEAAHESYGLVPLTADIVDGFVPQRKPDIQPSTRAFLVVPGELDTPEDLNGNGVFVKPSVHKRGLEFVIAFGSTPADLAKEIRENTFRSLSAATGIDAEDLEGKIVNDDDVPFEENIVQEVPQMLVHSMAHALARAASDTDRSWQRVDLDRRFIRRVRNRGAAALAAIGVIGASTLSTLSGHSITPADVAPVAAIVGGESAYLYEYTKRHLRTTNDRMESVRQHAAEYGAAVGTSIHNAYCRDHFNYQMAQEFPLETEQD